ncbi:T9SS C-terminal target domain-containing protein, partial [Chryseobacterium sp. LC2016-27]|nr:T9SS C-terminal target domain-containing protein [Chryseobacterium sp. LC2016-27]
IWLIRINEFGDELWQKTLGTAQDEEARSVIQTADLGFMVAGNVQNAANGFGSKDVTVTRLDKNGKVLSEMILGGRGLDEVEKMIPTPDGGALLGIYSRSSEFRDTGSESRGSGSGNEASN